MSNIGRVRWGATAVMAAAAALAFSPSGWASNYLGAERCKSCHEQEYRIWAAGPHARAHTSLTAKQLTDAKCNTCHTMLPDDLSPRYLGVQCERCHGAGRYYQHDFVMKDRELARAVGLTDVAAEACQQCHDEGAPSIEPFDFATLWAAMGHGRKVQETDAPSAK